MTTAEIAREMRGLLERYAAEGVDIEPVIQELLLLREQDVAQIVEYVQQNVDAIADLRDRVNMYGHFQADVLSWLHAGMTRGAFPESPCA